MIAFLWLAPLASADGTVVGNPTHLRFAAGSGLAFTGGTLSVTDQVVTFCDTTTLTIAIDAVLDVGVDELVLPAGEICAIDLYLDAAVTVAGTGDAGGTFAMTLNLTVVEITVDPSHTVSSTGVSDAIAVELAAPDWVTASMLQLGTGIHRNVTSTHALHDTLRDAIRFDGAIVE